MGNGFAAPGDGPWFEIVFSAEKEPVAGIVDHSKARAEGMWSSRARLQCAAVLILVEYRDSVAYAVAIPDFLTNDAHDSIPEPSFPAEGDR
jgi:hypothetical protein